MDVEVFLNRFNHFYDSVVRSFCATFSTESNSISVRVELSAQEETSGWTNLVLEVEEVTSFQFINTPKANYQVLSDGLNLLEKEGLFYIDFGHFDETPTDTQEFLKSPAHIIGRCFDWKIIPYSES